MALKFLNKKGWHTGSLRNIENVWKAEQKHEGEQKKLEELRQQIQEERKRDEFRLLQEKAGYAPRQERLEFLYDSGLSVGKVTGSSSENASGVAFKALEETVPQNKAADPSSSSGKQSAGPGALFNEDKPHSSNDTWRKLHSDPLLLIRQREQEALARIKNNPVQMALIRKSAEVKKEKDKPLDKKERRKKRDNSSPKHHKDSSSKQQSDSEKVSFDGRKGRENSKHKRSRYDDHDYKAQVDSDDESSERGKERRKSDHRGSKYREQSSRHLSYPKDARGDEQGTTWKVHDIPKSEKYSVEGQKNHDTKMKEHEKSRSYHESRSYDSAVRHDSQYKRRNTVHKLSEEEQAAKLREMQADAELHEEQRWKRLKKAEEDDAREATTSGRRSGGKNFLDAVQKSVYGAEKGGSSTIEESVRRRTHYLQGRSEAGGSNAFRR